MTPFWTPSRAVAPFILFADAWPPKFSPRISICTASLMVDVEFTDAADDITGERPPETLRAKASGEAAAVWGLAFVAAFPLDPAAS